MPFFVYILQCADDSLYVGSTRDLEMRLVQHNDGPGGQYTACRRPVQLIYFEECATISAAVARERQIKRWSAAKKRALAEGRSSDLKLLARRRH